MLILGFLVAAAAAFLVMSGTPSAHAAVWTDQADYTPGSVVTIHGDNSDGAGYQAGETVNVAVNGPDGITRSCSATADSSGAWSCQVTLGSGAAAVGGYAYTATGESSNVSQSGSFTDSFCPSSSPASRPTDPYVTASFTTSGNTATYSISTPNDSPTGGIPGLIEYCVYTSPVPSSVSPSYDSWTGEIVSAGFDFERPGGDPTNLPFDGSKVNVGQATWSGSVPSASAQTILLHINDPSECAALGQNSNTCFVQPGTGNQDLTVTKTATPSFNRTYTWQIAKSVDNTQIDIAAGGNAKFNYTVDVTHDNGTDSGWQVSGTIKVTNPNSVDFNGVNVTDAIDNNGNCSVVNGTNATIPAGQSVSFNYTCTYTSAPSPASGTNTATASWDKATYQTPDDSAKGTAPYDFTQVSPTIIDGSVTVTDTLGGSLGTASYTDSNPKEFTYSHTFSGNVGTCTKYDNTATFTTNTTGAQGSDSKTVTVCVGADLTVKKTATPSFTRTYKWGISKDVDQTKIDTPNGTPATFNYTVKVTHDSGTDSDWTVTGDITVTNPNDWEAITANVTDAINNGGICTVTGGSAVSIPAGKSVDLPYTCSYSSAPSPLDGTNTATATWDPNASSTPDGQATGQADANFATTTPTIVDGIVTVTDPMASPPTLGTVHYTDPSPTTFTYSLSFPGKPGTCTNYDNTATFTTNTTGTTGSDSKTVTVCVGADLTVKKTATPAFTRTFSWNIQKLVDKTEIDTSASSATFNYTVKVTHDSGTDSNWNVTGDIKVTNPNDWEAITADLTDAIDNGGTCTVNGQPDLLVSVPANSTLEVPYLCTYSSAPAPLDGTNTATATWDPTAASTPDGMAAGTADANFATITPTIVDGSVLVTDPMATPSTLGTVSYSDPSPTTFTYSITFPGTAGTCENYTNTATFTTDTFGLTGSDSKTVTVCVGADLTVKKTATPSFTRRFSWNIQKLVNKTEIDTSGPNATFHYTVNVTHDSGTDSNWMVTGDITVTNPNDWEAITTNVSDAISNGGSCSVQGGGANVSVPASQSVDLTYTCTYSSAPAPLDGTNTATAAWDRTAAFTPDGQATGHADANFATTTPTILDGSVVVTDPMATPSTLGTLSYTDPSPTQFMYSLTFPGTPGTCTPYTNTATFTTDDFGLTGSDSKTVKVCVGEDLTVSKTATPSFTRTYNWDIQKLANKTIIDPGGTVTYTVLVTEDPFTDSNWQVTGTITVSNPNDWEAITTNVADAIDNGGTCTVAGGSSVSVPANSSVQLNYTCTYLSAPSNATGNNTATAAWDAAKAATPDNSASGHATAVFSNPTKLVNQKITVTDSQAGTLGTVTASDTLPFSKTFTYSKKFSPPGSGCTTINNTATIAETGQTSSAAVKDCGSGALTMGFWHNNNGQAIITGGKSTGGVCNSATWLRHYAPFQDLSASATCAQVASYFLKIFNAANAGGASMNAMLKAQMLATALDVYFSDPALGGNKINAPQPIGGDVIDLTNASAAFGGATSLTVSQMLSYAASQSNSGGTVWYGQVKATQGLAEGAFDAINSGTATGP